MSLLTDHANNENVLELALKVLSHNPEDTNAATFAILYVIDMYKEQGKFEFTDEEVKEEVNDMLTSFILKEMVGDGLIDVDFNDKGEPVYSPTKLGIDIVQDLNKKLDDGSSYGNEAL